MKDRLEETARAHLAVCGLLQSTVLSDQTRRQLENLRKLLELEISRMMAERQDQLTPK